MVDRWKLVTRGAAALMLVAGAASAQTSTMNKCQGSKIKGAGKKAACLAGLQAKVVGSGATLDPAKVTKCQAKVGTAYGKLEAKGGCGTTGDATAIENKVDAFVDDLVTELNVGAPNKCQGAKIKDAGKKAACLAGLQAKFVGTGAAVDPAKVTKCQAKVGAAYAKLEAKGPCNTSGDATAIENKVDAFVDDLVTELNARTCCAPVRITMTSSAGTLTVGAFAPFPFPANVQTIVEVGSPDANCKHTGIVPAGGYYAPIFCIPALTYTSQVVPSGCESGGADGSATVWDAAAPSPDPDVMRVADTSDGDGGGPSCGTLGTGCTTAAGAAAGDTKGNINTTRGGAPLASGKLHTQIDIPVVSTTWAASNGTCPDSDGSFDPSADSLVTRFAFILSPTTGSSSAMFTDLNGDHCSSGGTAGAANPKMAMGSPANGPCCTVGQSTTIAATGTAFSGAFPLYDLTFLSIIPTTISSCGAPSSAQTCILTTDPCQD